MIASVAFLACSQAAPLDVQWWSTSQASTDRLTEKDPIPTSKVPDSSDSKTSTVVTIDLDTTFQKVVGFGGALTQSSAAVFASLPSDLQEEVDRNLLSLPPKP